MVINKLRLNLCLLTWEEYNLNFRMLKLFFDSNLIFMSLNSKCLMETTVFHQTVDNILGVIVNREEDVKEL